jgi:uncharacterized ferritin-like protein (DUF455 family)
VTNLVDSWARSKAAPLQALAMQYGDFDVTADASNATNQTRKTPREENGFAIRPPFI